MLGLIDAGVTVEKWSWKWGMFVGVWAETLLGATDGIWELNPETTDADATGWALTGMGWGLTGWAWTILGASGASEFNRRKGFSRSVAVVVMSCGARFHCGIII